MNARKIPIPPLPAESLRQVGHCDRGGRWYPRPEYEVPGAFNVRVPSRQWPWSYWHHAKTARYSALLLEHRPDLWIQLQDPHDAHVRAALADKPELLAYVTAQRMGVDVSVTSMLEVAS